MSRHPPIASNPARWLRRDAQGGHRPGRTGLRPVAGWGTTPPKASTIPLPVFGCPR